VIQITQNGAKTALSGKIPKSENLQWEWTTCLPDYSDWHGLLITVGGVGCVWWLSQTEPHAEHFEFGGYNNRNSRNPPKFTKSSVYINL